MVTVAQSQIARQPHNYIYDHFMLHEVAMLIEERNLIRLS